MTNKIALFSGSCRKASLNSLLAKKAANTLQSLGARADYIDLKEYNMAIYNGDDEAAAGVPEQAKLLLKLLSEHDMFVVSSPEYNGLPTPFLVNVLAWLSRVDVTFWQNKQLLVLAASPGKMGAQRNISHIKTLFSNLGAKVFDESFTWALATEDCSTLDNAGLQKLLEKWLEAN